MLHEATAKKINALCLVILSGFCTLFFINAVSAEQNKCLYFETAIENLLVDKMLSDNDESNAYNTESPLGKLHIGMLDPWALIFHSVLINHNSLGCKSESLINIFSKVPTLSKMGKQLLFIDEYFDVESGQYRARPSFDEPFKARVEDYTNDTRTDTAHNFLEVINKPITKNILNSEGLESLEARSPNFEIYQLDEVENSIIERMVWRKKIDNAGYIPLFINKNLLLLAGCYLDFYNGSGTRVVRQKTPSNVCYSTGYDYSIRLGLLAFEDGGELHLWDLSDAINQKAQPLICYGHTRQILQLKFSHKTSQIFTISDDGTQRVFDFTGKTCIESARYRITGSQTISATGKHFSIRREGEISTLVLLDMLTETEQIIRKEAADQSYSFVRYLRHLPVSNKLVAFGNSVGVKSNYADLANIWLIDLLDGSVEFLQDDPKAIGQAIRDHNIYDRTLAFSSDEKLVAYISGYSGNEIIVADLFQKKIIHGFEGIDKDATGVTFAPESHSLIIHNNENFGRGALHYFGLEGATQKTPVRGSTTNATEEDF